MTIDEEIDHHAADKRAPPPVTDLRIGTPEHMLLQRFDWMSVDIVDCSLCDASDGLRALLREQLGLFRGHLVKHLQK